MTDVARVRAGVASVWASVKRLVATGGALLIVAAWLGFWATVVRLHYLQGDYVDAAVTTAVLAVPVLLVGGQYLRGADLPGPGLREALAAISRRADTDG